MLGESSDVFKYSLSSYCLWHRMHVDFLSQVYLRISRIVHRSPIARGVNAIDRAHESRSRERRFRNRTLPSAF